MFEAQIRSLLQAQRLGHITADECQQAIDELEAQAQSMHPIPVDEAVESMAELARKRPGSAMGDSNGDSE